MASAVNETTGLESPLAEHGKAILAALPEVGLAMSCAFDELTLTVEPAHLHRLITYLRDDLSCLYICFIDLTVVDYPLRSQRFDVVTHLLSPKHNRRIRIKVATDEEQSIASLSQLYPAANWFEREAYDLFGVTFSGHPDLRRLLTDYGFDGHPMRKDFPMTGYVEVRYDDDLKRVIYEPVDLTQEYRSFDFLSPWEGAIDYVLPGDEKTKRNPQ
jgi:NADH-quinone oxidoreductase subunit C